MVEPVSLAAGAAGLIKSIKELIGFIGDVRNVDQVLDSFRQEMRSLEGILMVFAFPPEEVALALNQPDSASRPSDPSTIYTRLRESMTNSVRECSETVIQCNKHLEGFGSGGNIARKTVRHIQVDMKKTELSLARYQIQRCCTDLTLGLGTLNVLIDCYGHAATRLQLEKHFQKLENLESLVRRAEGVLQTTIKSGSSLPANQQLLLETSTSAQSTAATTKRTVDDTSEPTQPVQVNEDILQEAKKAITLSKVSTASSISSPEDQLVDIESVAGATKQERICRWRDEISISPRTSSNTHVSEIFDGDNNVTQPTESIPDTQIEEEHWDVDISLEDEAGDEDVREHIKSIWKFGSQEYESGRYEAARDHFCAIQKHIKMRNLVDVSDPPPHLLNYKLGFSQLMLRDFDNAKANFKPLVRCLSTSGDEITSLEAAHHIASILLIEGDLKNAQLVCSRARRGLKRLQGEEGCLYVQSVRLQAAIYAASGQEIDAMTFFRAIPPCAELDPEIYESCLEENLFDKYDPAYKQTITAVQGRVRPCDHGQSVHCVMDGALFRAANAGCVRGSKTLHQTATQANKEEAFLAAARAGHNNVVETLHDADIDINATDTKGRTALMLASGADFQETVETLLRLDASIAATTENGIEALHYAAACNDHPGIVKLLLASGASVSGTTQWTPLHENAYRNKSLAGLTIATTLIKAGADVNARAELEWTPLHCAAYQGNMACAKVLLDKKAAVNAINHHHCTPLHITLNSLFRVLFDGTTNTAGNVLAMTKLLLAHGADTSLETSDHRLPIAIARNRRDALQESGEGSGDMLGGFEELLELLERNDRQQGLRLRPKVGGTGSTADCARPGTRHHSRRHGEHVARAVLCDSP